MAEKTTLLRLADNAPEEFPADQARRILDLQQRMGTNLYAELTPEHSDDATNGPASQEPTQEAVKRGGTKTGTGG